jgi:hypothetical protein
MKGYAPGWQVRCCLCGLTFDAADLGMTFVGKVLLGKQYKLLWCQQCRWIRWMSVEHRSPNLPPTAGARCDLATHQHATSPPRSINWGLFCLGWFFASSPSALALLLITPHHGRHIALAAFAIVVWESIAALASLSIVRGRFNQPTPSPRHSTD